MNSGGATNALSHFECDPFDLLGNAPYSNPPKSSPEKGEKSRREQQIFNCRKQRVFDDGSLENQEKLPKCLLDFECDPFDLLGNAPYVNLQKSFPEKGEKSRREQQILSCRKCADFNDNTMENQEEFPKCRLDFESFPPCDFWWKLSEDGSTQRKPKSCGILRILASVFHFYLNPQGFPSSSHFCPEL